MPVRGLVLLATWLPMQGLGNWLPMHGLATGPGGVVDANYRGVGRAAWRPTPPHRKGCISHPPKPGNDVFRLRAHGQFELQVEGAMTISGLPVKPGGMAPKARPSPQGRHSLTHYDGRQGLAICQATPPSGSQATDRQTRGDIWWECKKGEEDKRLL